LQLKVAVLDPPSKWLEMGIPVNQAVEQGIHKIHVPWPHLQYHTQFSFDSAKSK